MNQGGRRSRAPTSCYYSKQYCLLFFLTTLLPIQDVPRGAKTHLGAAHTHFESYFGLRTVTT